MQPQNLRQLQVAVHKEWAWIPKSVVQRYMLLVPPRYEAVLLQERAMSVLDEFNS